VAVNSKLYTFNLVAMDNQTLKLCFMDVNYIIANRTT